MGRQYSAYIKGTNYNSGSWFTSCANFTGRAASDGTGARSTVTAGTGYQFIFCNPGAAYPYAIGYGGTVRCWVQASVFPNATYGIYYNANGGTGAPGAQTKTYGYNLALSGTIPTRAGHNFRGWATAPNGGAVYAAGGIYTANAGATLYAVWEPYRHGVVFNANGGTGAPGAQTKTYGSILTLSGTIPIRTGYTFKGWGTSAGTQTVSYNPGSQYGRDQNGGTYTLYAIWQINTYSVQYDANGGTGAPGVQTKTYGVKLTLSSVKPTKTGHTFKGWAVTQNGAVSYSAGAQYGANAPIKLYAVWEANSYSIAFNANGGSGSMGNEPMTYGVKKALTACTFYKTGHTFKGWAITPTGGKIYDDAAQVKDLTSVQSGVYTVYAVWEANKYTVIYNATRNGGTGDTQKTITYGTKLGTLPTATKKYYVFDGWYTAASGGKKVTENFVVTVNITLYAQYIIDASLYIRADGKEKPGFPYVYHNGKWCKGYAYARDKKGWQQGLSE